MLRAIIIACAAALALFGCTADKQYSQTELNALESREFDAGFDQAFDAAIGTLFDFGYRISASDKRGGLIQAGPVQLKVDAAGPRRTLVRVSTSAGGQVRVDKDLIEKVLDRIDQRLTAAAPLPTGARR